MTLLILDDVTKQVVCCSVIRTAVDTNTTNLRDEHIGTTENYTPENGEHNKPIPSVSYLTGQHGTFSLQLPKLSLDKLISKTFVHQMDDGNTYSAQIIQEILNHDAENHQNIKFLVKLGDENFDKIITYNTLSNTIENQLDQQANNADAARIFKGIKSHHGPITSNNPDYKDSSYNHLVAWEYGSETFEPLDSVIKDEPISVANYAHANNLLDTPGWKRLNHIAIHKNRLNKMAIQVNVSSTSGKGPVYTFGIIIPRNVIQAFELDAKNGNTLWKDAMTKEIKHI
jgi:hypothetical protein